MQRQPENRKNQKARDISVHEEIAASHVILDGDLSPSRLDGYLVRDREEDELDFKDAFDWTARTTKSKLEFVKDAIAMSNTGGGYIIYGVQEHAGSSTRFSLRGVSDEEASYFDPTQLKDLVERYVRRRIEISCAIVESKAFPSRRYGAVFIRPFTRGFAIPFEAEGQYEQPQGKRATVFSRGEIWVRRGAKSIKAQAEDVERLESEFRRREQAIWLEQHFQLARLIEEVNALNQRVRDMQGDISGEIQPIVVSRDRSLLEGPFRQLRERFIDILESKNDIVVRHWLIAPREQIMNIVKAFPEDADEQQRLIDNVVVPLLNAELTMGAVGLEFDQKNYFYVCIEVYRDIYQFFADSKEGTGEWPKFKSPVSPVIFWRDIILRLFILGAAAVRYKRYSYLPNIIQQSPYQEDYWKRHSYWARHALTMIARAGFLKPKSLCEMARQLAEQLHVIEPIFQTDDKAKTCLAQFDFIQAVTGVHRNGQLDDIYPNFAVYYTHRVSDLVRELLSKGAARSALPTMDDSKLKDIIRGLGQFASKEFFMSGWDSADWPTDLKKEIYEC